MFKEKVWPVIKEEKRPERRGKKAREFTIQDARTSWGIVVLEFSYDILTFRIIGFDNFFFIYSANNVECYKSVVIRELDLLKLTCFDGKYNLVNNEGKRRTVRINNLKTYLEQLKEML